MHDHFSAGLGKPKTEKQRYLVAIIRNSVLERLLDMAGETALAGGHRVMSIVPGRDGVSPLPPEADIVLMTPRVRLAPEFLSRAEQLRCILFPTIGVDPIDVPMATKRGIAIGHGAPRESVTSMAEATIGLMLALMQRLPGKQAVLARGGWRDPPVLGRMLRGRTLGLIGFGRIGQAVAHLLEPWQMRVVFHDRVAREPLANARPVPLDALLAESDVVSLHASLTQAGPMIGRRELALMKPEAVLLNTSRGGLLDEDALAEALEAGELAGAALDAFVEEPLPIASRLRKAPNIILTPHNAGHTAELMEALERTFLTNLHEVLSGRPPLHLYDPAVLQLWRARFGNTGSSNGESA